MKKQASNISQSICISCITASGGFVTLQSRPEAAIIDQSRARGAAPSAGWCYKVLGNDASEMKLELGMLGEE
ncbi:hypothetical protein JTE90_020121 [Oedothorax gibbosus]|uniref:Uncharacterized protein n=1 Tax=Oedothorax gibbosus TaxID=931172 RepID=A0AAV6VPP7_9ARAC|nr:hypothetical protein JTE90_020121 [Oedothorax gibbosus]